MRTPATSQAERAFFRALQQEGAVEKAAAELAPETAELLGVPAVSPHLLEQLEDQAAHAATPHGPGPAAEASGEDDGGWLGPGQGRYADLDERSPDPEPGRAEGEMSRAEDVEARPEVEPVEGETAAE